MLSTHVNYENNGYLTGRMLIATRKLDNTFFNKAVLYLCNHDESGAMGIRINHKMLGVTFGDLIKHISGLNNNTPLSLPIFLGGPVEMQRGFVIHSNDYTTKSTKALTNNIYLTATVDIIKDIASNQGPIQHIIALGYSGWGAKQLEKEISDNNWISIPADSGLMFSDSNTKWNDAAKLVGFNWNDFSTVAGHC